MQPYSTSTGYNSEATQLDPTEYSFIVYVPLDRVMNIMFRRSLYREKPHTLFVKRGHPVCINVTKLWQSLNADSPWLWEIPPRPFDYTSPQKFEYRQVGINYRLLQVCYRARVKMHLLSVDEEEEEERKVVLVAKDNVRRYTQTSMENFLKGPLDEIVQDVVRQKQQQ